MPCDRLMKPNPLIFAGLVTASLAHSYALASEVLATQNACMACHAVDEKVVGPSYKEIAKRYDGHPDALKRVTENIKKGGSGKWGEIPMPPYAQLSDDEASALAKWVLEKK